MGNKQSSKSEKRMPVVAGAGASLSTGDSYYNQAILEKRPDKQIPLYERAAAEYRIEKNQLRSAVCLKYMGESLEFDGRREEGAIKYVEAGKIFGKLGELDQANAVFEQGLEIMRAGKRTERVNAIQKEISEMTAAAFMNGKVDAEKYASVVRTSIEAMMDAGEMKLARSTHMKLVESLIGRKLWGEVYNEMQSIVNRATLDLDVDGDQMIDLILKFLLSSLAYRAKDDDFKAVDSDATTMDKAKVWANSKLRELFHDLLRAANALDWDKYTKAGDTISFSLNGDALVEKFVGQAAEELKALEARGAKKPNIKSEAEELEADLM